MVTFRSDFFLNSWGVSFVGLDSCGFGYVMGNIRTGRNGYFIFGVEGIRPDA